MKNAALVLTVVLSVATAVYAGDGTIVRNGKPISDSYIVTLVSHDSDPLMVAAEFGRSHGIKAVHSYGLALNGFSFSGSEKAARAISADPRVKRVEENGRVEAHAITETVPFGAWGLDRIDQRSLPLDGIYGAEYSGFGTVIYVIDSGINSVSDYNGRVRQKLNFVPDSAGNINPADVGDCVTDGGHGTLVGSIAAGNQYGVAKGAGVVSVRVLDCANAFTDAATVIAGVNWVVSDHQQNHPDEQAVANMSLGTSPETGVIASLDDAVMNAVKAGITVVVSAGNNSTSACKLSPAHLGNPNSYPTPNHASVITVAMTTRTDAVDEESNLGSCVDIFAPGRYTAGVGKDGQIWSGYGTSFAAAYVSGVAAIHMQRYGIRNSPGSIEGIIKDSSTQGVVTGMLLNAPNLLLYNSIPRRRPCC